MQIAYSKTIGKDVKRLKDKALRDRLEKVVHALKLAESLYDFHGDIKSLTGSAGYYRIRIGDYRLILRELDNHIELLHFRHRKDIYKEFP